jgi:hypothetical protein
MYCKKRKLQPIEARAQNSFTIHAESDGTF